MPPWDRTLADDFAHIAPHADIELLNLCSLEWHIYVPPTPEDLAGPYIRDIRIENGNVVEQVTTCQCRCMVHPVQYMSVADAALFCLLHQYPSPAQAVDHYNEMIANGGLTNSSALRSLPPTARRRRWQAAANQLALSLLRARNCSRC